MANKPNINPENIGAGLGELKSRLLFLLFALFVYRIGTHIPVPGIDPLQLQAFFDQNEGTFAGLFNMFSGGALERMSIVALGIMPYISASIVRQFQILCRLCIIRGRNTRKTNILFHRLYRQPVSQETALSRQQPISPGVVTVLRGTNHAVIINMNDAESLAVAEGPFVIVEQ